jgi:hypothetical protein
MEPSFNFPQDDFALAILTHAAMQTNRDHNTPSSHTSNSNSGYNRSSGPSSTLTGADVRGSSATSMISNHNPNLGINRSPDSSLARSRPQDILSYTSAVPSSRSMETLTFNPAQTGRQNSYVGPTYHGIGSQISQNYAQSLGILNAESYDDGRAQQRSGEMRLKQTAPPDPLLQFGMMETPEVRTDSDELDKGSRRRRKHKIDHQIEDDDEEARKKARGRPRVDTKDETAADVSSIHLLIYFQLCPAKCCTLCRSWTLNNLEEKQFLFKYLRHVYLHELDADVHFSGGELKYEWPREPTAIVKRPLSPPWKSKSKT